MTSLIVLITTFVVFLLAGRLGVRPLRSWVIALRGSLAVMFLVTASAHFGRQRDDSIRMVPEAFPDPALLVTLTGLAEIAGAIGLLIPRLAPWAAGGLALLLLAIFPANVHAANAGLTFDGRPVPALVPRALAQLLFLGAVLVAGFAPRWQARRRRLAEA